MPTVYGKPNGFSRASSNAEGPFVNTDPGRGSGIDAEIAGQFDTGICAGISTAWVIAFLNGDGSASSTDGFLEYFNSMLRFQGAYLFNYKTKQGVSTTTHGMEKFLDPLAEVGLASGVHKKKLEEVKVIGTSIFPDGTWAAYTVVPGHAIAIGQSGGSYFIMDPNYGLHAYDDKVKFILDLNYLVYAYRQCFGLGPDENTVRLFFYGAGMRARSGAISR